MQAFVDRTGSSTVKVKMNKGTNLDKHARSATEGNTTVPNRISLNAMCLTD